MLETPDNDVLSGRFLFGSGMIEVCRLLVDSISSMFQGETLSGCKNVSDVASHRT
jgi:hypothetical protein